MSSIFTKIINREIPAYIVSENDLFIAFLDINPLVLGHVLVVPKVEVDYFFDLDDTLLSEMILFSKSVSKKIKKAFPCKKIGLSIKALEMDERQKAIKEYGSTDSGASLGDILGAALDGAKSGK